MFSATHAEIQQGLTTDIYFVRTLQILKAANLEEAQVFAEVFPSRSGILCGVEELKTLLSGRNIEVHALPEGERFCAREVVLTIEGKYTDFGFLETPLLGILASSSGWATKTQECKEAAGELPLLCFGSRHVHPAVAPVMERAALVGGADGASCILGALLAGKKPSGTIPHACILIVGDTVRAARLFDEALDKDTPRIILVDTFKDEAEEALCVAEALKAKLFGIRLDTPSERGGVTPDLVKEVKHRLSLSGFEKVRVFVSGGLDPEKIRKLKQAGADGFGVGSFIAASPPIDMTMDIKEINGKPAAKRGRLPGRLPNPRLQKLELD